MSLVKDILRRGIYVRVDILKILREVRKMLRVGRHSQSRTIKKIIIHCSASDFGDVATIRRWHLERGFVDIGYHFVILNGSRKPGAYDPDDDGKIEKGRPWWKIGAHCKGHNRDSLGICLVGNPKFIGTPEMWFTPRQLESLRNLVAQLLIEFQLTPEDVFGHNDFARKICPGFKVQSIREWWK